jgi:hypothetical protein
MLDMKRRSGSAEAFAPLVAAFRDGLREVGYVSPLNLLGRRAGTTSCPRWPPIW